MKSKYRYELITEMKQLVSKDVIDFLELHSVEVDNQGNKYFNIGNIKYKLGRIIKDEN